MAARAKLVAQALAVALVAALLGLLVWKVAFDEGSEVPAALARGESIPAPGFDLPRLDGSGRLTLASLRGKAVVVNFWASWCRPCVSEAPLLEQAWRTYRARGLVLVGIDTRDFTGDAKRFARKYKITYPLVHDGKGETFARYGGTAFPETYFVDRRGRLVGDRIQGAVSREELEAGIERALG